MQLALLRAARQLPEGSACRFASCINHAAICPDSAPAAAGAGHPAAEAPAQLTSLRSFAAGQHSGGRSLQGNQAAETIACRTETACHRPHPHAALDAASHHARRCSFAAAGAAAPGSNPESIVEADSRVCWQCGGTVPRVSFFFCNECNVIQPAVPTADYFLLLDLPPGFDVDQKRLEASYKWLQRRVHPDKFSTASPEEQGFSEEQSSLVSGAYSTLRDPLRRAIYLLERGGKLEAGSEGEGMTAAAPEMLMRVMEVREQIEEAQDDAELDKLRADNRQEEAQQLQALSAAFGAGDLDAALELTAQLKYTERIKQAISQRTG